MSEPGDGAADGRNLFLVQDPALRSAVMPLFAIDRRDLAGRPVGCGTTFRIDPWGGCATAFHVIEDLLEARGGQSVLKEHQRLLALELEGIPYGAPPIRPEQWRNFAGMHTLATIDDVPGKPSRLRNVTELASLIIPRSPGKEHEPLFLGVDLRRWSPAVGARVTAYGFADLDLGDEGAADDRPISQDLYGSSATITDIEPMDPTRGRPWPFFRVDRDWPGGMSGGPVVNEHGHVIGLVSTGMTFAASGSAVFLSGSGIAEGMFPQIDPGAPGHVFCWAGFDADDAIAAIAPTREALATMAAAAGFHSSARVSFNASNGDYIVVDG